MRSLDEQYLDTVRIARGKVEAVPDPAARAALEAVLDAVGRLHMMLLQHESATSKSFYEMEGRIQNVLSNP
jgi:hypothetical protein